MLDIISQWLAATAHSINIGGYVTKLFHMDINPREHLGVAKITPVIFCGSDGGSGEYHAASDPNGPSSHIIAVDVPDNSRIINAWYSPLHNIPAMLAFALIDVEPHDDTHICLKIAAFPNTNTRMRIAVNVLYATQ